METLLQPKPPHMEEHTHEFSFEIKASRDKVWKWLNRPETFTEGQIPPFRVEFYSPDPDNIPNGFHEGVLNVHHGPLMNFAGVLTKIEKPFYRDLQYYYGSYALTMRWIRPFRLEFWLDESDENKTILKCRISSYIKPSMRGFWSTAQKYFWARFRSWAKKQAVK